MKRSKPCEKGDSEKTKENGDLDDLWGEEFHIDDIDNCLKILTEDLAKGDVACTQKNVITILPSYNIFTTEASTSTQIAQPGASNNVVGRNESTCKRHHSPDNSMSNHPVETKVKRLEECCLAKKEEVDILRSQIQEMNKSSERDRMKNQMEWEDRLKEVTKKFNDTTNELELKNSEIVNLKLQFGMLELNGLNQPSTSGQSQTDVPNAMESENLVDWEEDCNLLVLEEDQYPLKNAFPLSTFEFAHRETFMIDFEQDSKEYKHNHVTRVHLAPYINLALQRYHSKIQEFKPKVTYLKADRLLNFGYVHSDLLLMMTFSSKEFKSEDNYWYFNKLVCTSEELMDNFYQYLVTIKEGLLKYEDTNDAKEVVVHDFNLSPLISEHWYYNELGISARQGIACLAKMLPHCSYLRAYMLQRAKLKFTEKDDYLNYLSVTRKQKESNYKNIYNFLKLIHFAIGIIKTLELECFSSGFLCSVMDLLRSSVSVQIDELTANYIFDISFTMFSGKSTPNTCAYALNYAKFASNHAMFVNKLCTFPEKEGSCVMHLFIEQLETCLFNLDELDLSIPSANFIGFSLNIFVQNPTWIYSKGDRMCKCLTEFVAMTVNVIYPIIKKYRDNLYERELHDKFYDINLLMKCVKLLHLLDVKCSKLLVSSACIYPLYADAIYVILDFKHLLTAEQQEELSAVSLKDLLSDVELPAVDVEKLNGIPAWTTNCNTFHDTDDDDIFFSDHFSTY